MITEVAPEIPEGFPEFFDQDVALVEEMFKPLMSVQPKRTRLICDGCHVSLNMYRDRKKILPVAFSEETINGHVIYWCRDCTMKAYDNCEPQL